MSGRHITFYLPGMFSFEGCRGKYPAISITGRQCALQCDHCRSKILYPMRAAVTPDALLRTCVKIWRQGNYGVLISGGCNVEGRLPWEKFLSAIEKIKQITGLYVSVHTGILDDYTALRLKEAGIDQALIDVIGDDETLRKVCHATFDLRRIISTLESLHRAGIVTVPHIVCGLHFGEMKGERNAINMVAPFEPEQIVIISLMKIPGTPFQSVKLPQAHQIAQIILEGRALLPKTRISLGCARERGNTALERLALEAGVDKMALPSEETIQWATHCKLKIGYQKTCCSVPNRFPDNGWLSETHNAGDCKSNSSRNGDTNH